MAKNDQPRSTEPRGRVPDSAGEPEALDARVEDARAEADEQRRRAEAYLDLAQRAQADFQNYRRRVEQERKQVVKDANAELLRKVLPVLDDLERALGHVPQDLSQHSWAEGVSLIGQKLQAILEQQGLTRIGAEGEQFDPRVHEAVAYEEHPQYGEGQVAGVYRPGYRLHERVLRPAQVAVARAPSVSSPAREEEPRAGRGSRQRATDRSNGAFGESPRT
ncbi:MAG TPA: nucleotide exchange factor GrpE [Chloroflexota bacterium]|nr:nucleotide exchange factor GrpE [Chloroflexota bacterium]